MPITEFVLPTIRPTLARDGLATVRKETIAITRASGLLRGQVGQVLRLNGTNVEEEHRPVLSIEWDRAESFHAFFPHSDLFQQFKEKLMPYMAGPAMPVLFTPRTKERSESCFGDGVAQVFFGEGGVDAELEGAWDQFVKSSGVQKEWSGWGIENAEGTFVGILGWSGLEEAEAVVQKESVKDALEKLLQKRKFENYVMQFE